MKFPTKKYKDINLYLHEYTENLNLELNRINKKQLIQITDLIIKTIKNKKNIFVCGNGGSAAIANHYVCDYLKMLRTNTNLKPKIYSLSSNLELISAISNDLDYDEVFKYQAESLCSKDDLIILISSSGNSRNIFKLIKWAKLKKIKTIGFSGFKGGIIKKSCNLSINLNLENYGLSEDSHHILMHVMMQFIRQKFLTTDQIKKIKF